MVGGAGVSKADTRVKRETGGRPVRTRHCEYGVWLSFRLESLGKTGKADGHVLMYEPGDLPFIGTGRDSGSRVIDRTAGQGIKSCSFGGHDRLTLFRVSFLMPFFSCVCIKHETSRIHGRKRKMKKKFLTLLMSAALTASALAGCGTTTAPEPAAPTEAPAAEPTKEAEPTEAPTPTEEVVAEPTDEELAAHVAELIDAIYVQERTDETDAQCKEAKEAWDALTDAQKEMVEGEDADPDYFGRDTGDASKDDPRNADDIGENEILVVSFGTSFNDSRAKDIGGIEKAIADAYPDWAVRRAFTAQIIINHVQARDEEFIDNMEQAMDRAVSNGVKNLIIQPTHLMHGAEYDEMKETVDKYASSFESVVISEPLLGEVGADATVINEDKKTVAEAITAAAVAVAGFDSLKAAEEGGTAFVFMGHGTAHTAKVSYSQMATQMEKLGYANVFIGTVEGEPESTACESVIEAVKAAGYKKVVLRPLMVVAGDHANNDMAGDDEDSWKNMFEADGSFDSIDCQIAGLGRIETVEQLYVSHIADVIGE